MTNTIEVPISLIKAGDMDAIRELLPRPDLFGRWATHPEYGRGIIISVCPTVGGRVRFAYKNEDDTSDIDWDFVLPAHLTLDPVEPAHPESLETEEDYKNAPVGTIVARNEDYPFVKNGPGGWWDMYSNMFDEKEMAGTSRKVLRWGWGE